MSNNHIEINGNEVIHVDDDTLKFIQTLMADKHTLQATIKEHGDLIGELVTALDKVTTALCCTEKPDNYGEEIWRANDALNKAKQKETTTNEASI